MNRFLKFRKDSIFRKLNSLAIREKYKEEFVFIHIGKCGGTTFINNLIENHKSIKIFHMKRPTLNIRNNNKKYFFIIRNPLKRFVSAFNYSKSIIEFNTDNIDIESLSIENCPAPYWIKRKIANNGVAINKKYDSLIQSFSNPNELAESLSSNNYFLRNKAETLMKNKNQHIFKGIGWYLHNGDFIKVFNKKIIFVGRLEYLDHDLSNLYDNKNVKELNNLMISNLNTFGKRLRKTNLKYEKYLSNLAVNNLKRYYSKTDYLALSIMNEYGFIDSSTLDEYNNYLN
tara:strand:- start:2725 stop:3582 length:858 start_codon:yes stop_codon:yes gene_type:complete